MCLFVYVEWKLQEFVIICCCNTGIYAATKLVQLEGASVNVQWGNETKAAWTTGSTSSSASILRLLGINATNADATLYRGTAIEKTEVHDTTFCVLK